MDFALNEEQSQAVALAQQILKKEAQVDHLKSIEASGDRCDRQLWHKLAESGLLGAALEERYGGMGFGFETLCLLAQEVGATVAPVPFVPCLSSALLVQQFGSKEQAETLLPAVSRGESLLTLALSEPGNDEPAAPACEITQEDGELRLVGTKHLVPYAAQAQYVVVTARRAGQLEVLLMPLERDGVAITLQDTTTGEPAGVIHFEGARVEPGDILVQGEAADVAVAWLTERVLVANCFMLLGVVETMLQLTARYTSEREQFGRAIATFQAVSHRAADAYIDVENLRLVCHQAASLLEAGQDAEQAIYIAKIWASDVGHRVSQSAQHLHGGIGVDKDYPLFRYCLWAKQLELSLGSGHAYLARLGHAIATEFKEQVA